jgi:hypothetical protein
LGDATCPIPRRIAAATTGPTDTTIASTVPAGSSLATGGIAGQVVLRVAAPPAEATSGYCDPTNPAGASDGVTHINVRLSAIATCSGGSGITVTAITALATDRRVGTDTSCNIDNPYAAATSVAATVSADATIAAHATGRPRPGQHPAAIAAPTAEIHTYTAGTTRAADSRTGVVIPGTTVAAPAA